MILLFLSKLSNPVQLHQYMPLLRLILCKFTCNVLEKSLFNFGRTFVNSFGENPVNLLHLMSQRVVHLMPYRVFRLKLMIFALKSLKLYRKKLSQAIKKIRGNIFETQQFVNEVAEHIMLIWKGWRKQNVKSLKEKSLILGLLRREQNPTPKKTRRYVN